VKISNKNFSFFSSRNQYFPHIPYVASKNEENCQCFRKKLNFVSKTMKKPVFLRFFRLSSSGR
jgi:hypothetical protein